MKRCTQIILQTTLILLTLGLMVNAQPVQVTDIPNNSTNFNEIGDLVYFSSGNALWRTDGSAAGTILIKTGLPTAPFSFRKFKTMQYS